MWHAGEHIKNWRQRYFVLREDGTLIGFKAKPEGGNSEPLNNFTVRGCQVLKCEKPRPFTFMLRGLQWTTVIERTFATETDRDRDEWCQAIEHVSSLLQAADEDVEMMEEPQDGKGNKLHIGCRTSSSRGRKITLDDFEFLKVLGKGTFGKVILCREKATQLLYAIKVLKKEVIIAKDEVAHTLTENRVLKNTKHPFLIVSPSVPSCYSTHLLFDDLLTSLEITYTFFLYNSPLLPFHGIETSNATHFAIGKNICVAKTMLKCSI